MPLKKGGEHQLINTDSTKYMQALFSYTSRGMTLGLVTRVQYVDSLHVYSSRGYSFIKIYNNILLNARC